MGNNYSHQQTYMCCETCVKNKKDHKIKFLNTGTPYKDECNNVWIEVRYQCTNGHLFYTCELKSNYCSRIERHNAQINEINRLKQRVAELEKIISQNNIIEQPSAPMLVVAECVNDKNFVAIK